MLVSRSTAVTLALILGVGTTSGGNGLLTTERDAVTRSGLRAWVDPDTPTAHQTYSSSRYQGDGKWLLVMSDEFNEPGRSFLPGEDHVWTSLEKPDGVNAALEVYAHNMTTTACDDDGCHLLVRVEEATSTVRIWNGYADPPQNQRITFHYRAAMIQSWNKFCMQGGLVEVRAQLPGAVSPKAKNPDIVANNGDPHAPVHALAYYPTWPGIWMLGNLGRAIFSASTHRMWPFSYSECDPKVFPPSNQRISACDSAPGHGLNPLQGRGAPEIDILEGGGTDVSVSIQVAPGMPKEFRVLPPDPDIEIDRRIDCIYRGNCLTPGANAPDLPKRLYSSQRSYKTWYQGVRYASNNECFRNASKVQSYMNVAAALETGLSGNICTVATCPASQDPNGDFGLLPGAVSDDQRWGINTNGTCFAVRNAYTGSFICSPGNPLHECEMLESDETKKKKSASAGSGDSDAFAYQMDAISANYGLHTAAYTSYLVYQVEWDNDETSGYVRWLLNGAVVFEIPASTITSVPQDSEHRNPRKLMVQEPLYLIVNVAVSSFWGAQPPNPKKRCRGDGHDPVANAICGDFPMFLKLDYVRVYQDTSAASKMAVGCDPKSHPTRQWIADHVDDYQDDDNKVVDVIGRAFCRDDDDCSVPIGNSSTPIQTGRCVNRRCQCIGPFWAGPRCIQPVKVAGVFPTTVKGAKASVWGGRLGGIAGRFLHGPPLSLAVVVGSLLLVLAFVSGLTIQVHACRERRLHRVLKEKDEQEKATKATASSSSCSLSPGDASNSFRVLSSSSSTLSPLLLHHSRLDAVSRVSSSSTSSNTGTSRPTPAMMMMTAMNGQDRCLHHQHRLAVSRRLRRKEQQRHLERRASKGRELCGDVERGW